MPISVACGCGKRYQVADSLAGRMVRCPACSREFPVPAAEDNDAYELANELDDDLRRQPQAGSRQSASPPRSVSRSGSVASNPGQFSPNLPHYYYCFPGMLVLCAVMLVLILVTIVRGGPAILPGLLVVAMLLFIGHEILTLRRKCRLGCVNPGMIVSIDPPLVAVTTNLSKIGHDRPALKVIRQPLGRMTGGPPTVGMRVPTVAYYFGPNNEDTWRDFAPEVINCMTTELQTVDDTLYSIPKEEWNELTTAVSKLTQFEPGLYRMSDYSWATRGPETPSSWQKLQAVVILSVVCVPVIAVLFGKPPEEKPQAAKPANAPLAPAPPPPVAPPQVAQREEPRANPAVNPPDARPAPPPEAAPPQPQPGEVVAPPQPAAPPVAAQPAPTPAAAEPFAVDLGAISPAAPRAEAPPATAKEPPAQAPAPAGGPFKPGDRVEVKWGNSWWPSKIVKFEGGKYLVDYDDWSSDDWAAAADVRAAAPPLDIAKLKIGDRLEAKEATRIWLPASVVAIEGQRVKVRFDGRPEAFDKWKESHELRANAP